MGASTTSLLAYEKPEAIFPKQWNDASSARTRMRKEKTIFRLTPFLIDGRDKWYTVTRLNEILPRNLRTILYSTLDTLVNLAASKSRILRCLVAYVSRLFAVWEREGLGCLEAVASWEWIQWSFLSTVLRKLTALHDGFVTGYEQHKHGPASDTWETG